MKRILVLLLTASLLSAQNPEKPVANPSSETPAAQASPEGKALHPEDHHKEMEGEAFFDVEIEPLPEKEIQAFLEKQAPEFVDNFKALLAEGADPEEKTARSRYLSEIIMHHRMMTQEGEEIPAAAFLAMVKAEWGLEETAEAHQKAAPEDKAATKKKVAAAFRNVLEKEIAMERIDISRMRRELDQMEKDLKTRETELDQIVEEELDYLLEAPDEVPAEEDAKPVPVIPASE